MTADKPMHLVPKLRFAEFVDAPPWECPPLKKLAKRITQRNTHGADLKTLTNSAEHGVVDQREYFDRDIATNTGNYYIVKTGDYVYNPRSSSTAPVGPISKNQIGTGVMSPIYTVFRFRSDANEFFAHYFRSSHWHGYVRRVSNSGARHDRMAIANDDLMQMPIPTPSPCEQQMIADCLGSLDDLIAAEDRKLKALQQHRQGLMQQLFPRRGEAVPQLRFAEFVDEPPWECPPLKKLAKRITQRNTGAAHLRTLTNSAEHGVVDQREYFDRDITTNTDNYYIVETGDYVYNPRCSATAPVGPISKNQIGTGVVSPIYTVFRFQSAANDFFAHYFRSSHWHGYLRRVSNSGARHDRMAITNHDLMQMPIPTPTLPEQRKIADCLDSLDDLIAAEDGKFKALRQHKQGIMQQLFPSLEAES